MLFSAASSAIQNDESLERFYVKKGSEGKHHFSALNAIAAKLLRILSGSGIAIPDTIQRNDAQVGAIKRR